MQKTEHIKRAVDAAIKTLVVPVPVPVATPTITAPSLPKLKALSTRKLGAVKVAEPPPPEGVNVKDWDRILQQGPEKTLRTIPGGKAEGKPIGKYDKEQLGKGMKVEREHTGDPLRAEEITTDHLEEFPTYYTALEEMEKRLSEGKTAGYRLGVRNAIRLVANMY